MAVLTAAGLPLHQLSADTYQRIVEAGMLEGQRVELLDGIMSEMSPQSGEHAELVETIAEYLRAAGRVRTHSPFEIASADSVPEPDVLLTTEPLGKRRHPRSALVVVEVAVSSQAVDRGIKARLYAVAGVPVYWLIDVPGAAVEVRSRPLDGVYQEVATYGPGQVLPAPAAGLESLAVSSLSGEVPSATGPTRVPAPRS